MVAAFTLIQSGGGEKPYGDPHDFPRQGPR